MGNQDEIQAIEEKINKPLNKILKWIEEKVAKRPFTALAIGIIGIILSIISISIAITSRTTKEPVFIVSPSELIAQSVNGEEKLKIFWDDKEIKNVASVKIGIWNNGYRFIDKNDVSSTTPIRIKPLEKSDILAVQILKTSRPTLEFDTNIEKDADSIESVVIKIKGDEALERFDGALFHVLFSGSKECTWKVIGRIKGVPKGFQPKDWAKVHRSRNLKWWFPAVPVLMLFAVIFILISEISLARRKERKIRWLYLLVMGGNALFFVAYWILTEYSYLLAPSWLSWY